MYRHAPSLAVAQLPSPSPEGQSGPRGLDVTEALIRKRKQVDAEIQEFRARKEQEFRDFERDLRNRSGRNRRAPVTGNPLPRARSSLLSFLTGPGSTHNALSRADKDSNKSPRGDPMNVDGQSESTANSNVAEARIHWAASTTNLLNEDEPHLKLGSENSHDDLSESSLNNGQLTRNPTPRNNSRFHPSSCTYPLPSPPVSTSKATNSSSSIAPDRDTELQGLFTPLYLSLLDSKHSSLPESSQQISQSELGSTFESPSSSILPSTSLPSALRRSSSEQKKPKQVLFRLSDAAIVKPSSSYEERPSMSSPKEVSPLRQRMLDDNAAGYLTPVRTPTPALNTRKEPTLLENLEGTEDRDEDMFALDEEYIEEKLSNIRVLKSKDKDLSADLDINIEDGQNEREGSGSPAAGSLPIDIIKPRKT